MIHLKDQEVIEDNNRLEPIEDLIRIQKALFLLRNIYCTLDECGNIWQEYSWSVSASWLFIPQCIESIIKNIESMDCFMSYESMLLSYE